MCCFLLTEKDTGALVNLIVPEVKTRGQANAFLKLHFRRYVYHYSFFINCSTVEGAGSIVHRYGFDGVTITKEKLKN